MRDTSLAANRAAEPLKQSKKDLIYDTMAKYGIVGNFEAIAKSVRMFCKVDMKDATVWKRLSDLKNDGRIIDNGTKSKTSSNVLATDYRAVLPQMEQGNLF